MMEGDTTMAARIDRKTSIEFEPRTLRMEQIQFAREAALYVLNTSSIEAALSIFTEGVEPVVGVARRNGDAINGMEMSKEKQYLEKLSNLVNSRIEIASCALNMNKAKQHHRLQNQEL